MVAKFVEHNNRELKQREKQNSNSFRLEKQQICTCVTLLYISQTSGHDSDKLPNFTRPLYGLDEHKGNKFLFLFLNLDTVLSDSTTENFANI